MAINLFRKKIEPSCSYCRHGSNLGQGNLICVKKGIVQSDSSCPKFSYDPFRRRPPETKKLNTKGFSEDDFTL